MGLNGANGSGRSVEEETDKRRRGTRGGIMQCGTSREAVLAVPAYSMHRCLLLFTISTGHFRECK